MSGNALEYLPVQHLNRHCTCCDSRLELSWRYPKDANVYHRLQYIFDTLGGRHPKVGRIVVICRTCNAEVESDGSQWVRVGTTQNVAVNGEIHEIRLPKMSRLFFF